MNATRTLTPLGMEDAQILALETGPIRGHTLKVLVVEAADSELAVDELRAQVAKRLQSEPHWTERLVPAPHLPSRLAWQPDPNFDIDRHIGLCPVQGPVDDVAFARCIAEIMMGPLDRSRPLWTIDVIPRLADGRAALVWKIHHCLADGFTIMRTGARILWTEQSRAAAPEQGHRKAPAAPAQVTAGARLVRGIGYRGLMIREFRRVWGLSPLAGEVGPDRIAASVTCRLDEVRALGKAVGPDVTINDVLLAIVAGALRRWLEARSAPTSTMKVQVPVSMHNPGDGAGDAAGNRNSFLLLRLPVDESDPVARVRAVARATGRRKNRHDARAIYALRESLSRAPAWVQHRVQHVVQGPHEYSLSISNVPGPRGPVTVLNRRVEALYPFAEVAPHHGLRIAAVSLEGSLFIGLLADRHLIPDLDGLARSVSVEVGELRSRLSRA